MPDGSVSPTARPIADGLFTWPSDSPRLYGGHCAACDAWAFPVAASCPRCGSLDIQQAELSDRGTLWSWTSQGFNPKAPYNGQLSPEDRFVPWYVGVVDLPGQVRLETLLTGVAQDDLKIGMDVQLTVIPFRTDEDGEVVTFAFAPVA